MIKDGEFQRGLSQLTTGIDFITENGIWYVNPNDTSNLSAQCNFNKTGLSRNCNFSNFLMETIILTSSSLNLIVYLSKYRLIFAAAGIKKKSIILNWSLSLLPSQDDTPGMINGSSIIEY
eukprot:NODE_160_length_15021_cov_0.894786.p11 type:complete len:120 gc:universal NODE_160_length_15021_cov_0.894786:2257-2616(+)